jgi:sugar phosphate isomerase/epimerase
MQIGLLTDSLSSLTRAEALDLAAELGVQTVEIGLGGDHGGWSPAPHADIEVLLADAGARATLKRDIAARGLREVVLPCAQALLRRFV